MDQHRASIAERCHAAALAGAMPFPEAVGTLMREGFESYTVDFRCATTTYYLADGDNVSFPMPRIETPVALAFDPAAVGAAIREARQLAPGYTYIGFCSQVAAAGCAGYLVSFPGRRALYIGRTAETHTELFPD